MNTILLVIGVCVFIGGFIAFVCTEDNGSTPTLVDELLEPINLPAAKVDPSELMGMPTIEKPSCGVNYSPELVKDVMRLDTIDDYEKVMAFCNSKVIKDSMKHKFLLRVVEYDVNRLNIPAVTHYYDLMLLAYESNDPWLLNLPDAETLSHKVALKLSYTEYASLVDASRLYTREAALRTLRGTKLSPSIQVDIIKNLLEEL